MQKPSILQLSSMVSTGFKAGGFDNNSIIFFAEIVYDFSTGLMLNL